MGSQPKPTSRLLAIDALRGAIMIIMALDHVRDFLHAGAMSGSPTDLSQTTPTLFFTRWITHFCLPVFMFTAGMGSFLRGERHHTKGQLSRFLWTRGVWLVLLELTVMRMAYNFNTDLRFPVLLLILWIFGWCMIAMAALVYLPVPLLACLSAAVILFHNCLDSIQARQFGSAAWLWNFIHQPGAFTCHREVFFVSYPLIPWIAVMAGGFCFGRIFLFEPAARRRILLRAGFGITAGFFVIRAVNLYGDPARWSAQKSGVFTLLSFLNCTKYPASLDFLLMTLGPSLLLLAYFDTFSFKPGNPLIVFGRVPLFFFVAHFYAIHVAVVLLAWIRYGSRASAFVFNPVPSMGGPRPLFPPDFGYPLGLVYVFWVLLVISLYPVCRWFARVKASRRDWWLSYL